MKYPGFDTISLHGGQRPDPVTGARAAPIYQTTSFVFTETDQAASMFDIAKDFGPDAFLHRARREGLGDFGAALSPANAFYILQGVETLALRDAAGLIDALGEVQVTTLEDCGHMMLSEQPEAVHRALVRIFTV